jgi:hypothetical protein
MRIPPFLFIISKDRRKAMVQSVKYAGNGVAFSGETLYDFPVTGSNRPACNARRKDVIP